LILLLAGPEAFQVRDAYFYLAPAFGAIHVVVRGSGLLNFIQRICYHLPTQREHVTATLTSHLHHFALLFVDPT